MWSVTSNILFIFMGTFSYKVTNIKRFMIRLLAAGQTKKYIVKNVCSSWLQTKQPCLSALLWFQNCKLCSWRNLDTRVIAEFTYAFTWNSLQLEWAWEWSFSYHMCFSSLCLHVWEQRVDQTSCVNMICHTLYPTYSYDIYHLSFIL